MTNYQTVFETARKAVSLLYGDSCSLSAPMPDMVDGTIRVDSHFVYPVRGAAVRGRPFALVVSDMESGMILSIQHSRVADFMDSAGCPRDGMVDYTVPQQMSVREYKAATQQLVAFYEEIRPLAFQASLTKGQRETVRSHLALLNRIAPPGLLPYYSVLGARYVRWAQQPA